MEDYPADGGVSSLSCSPNEQERIARAIALCERLIVDCDNMIRTACQWSFTIAALAKQLHLSPKATRLPHKEHCQTLAE